MLPNAIFILFLVNITLHILSGKLKLNNSYIKP